jgi:hypothetical protein
LQGPCCGEARQGKARQGKAKQGGEQTAAAIHNKTPPARVSCNSTT